MGNNRCSYAPCGLNFGPQKRSPEADAEEQRQRAQARFNRRSGKGSGKGFHMYGKGEFGAPAVPAFGVPVAHPYDFAALAAHYPAAPPEPAAAAAAAHVPAALRGPTAAAAAAGPTAAAAAAEPATLPPGFAGFHGPVAPGGPPCCSYEHLIIMRTAMEEMAAAFNNMATVMQASHVSISQQIQLIEDDRESKPDDEV